MITIEKIYVDNESSVISCIREDWRIIVRKAARDEEGLVFYAWVLTFVSLDQNGIFVQSKRNEPPAGAVEHKEIA